MSPQPKHLPLTAFTFIFRHILQFLPYFEYSPQSFQQAKCMKN